MFSSVIVTFALFFVLSGAAKHDTPRRTLNDAMIEKGFQGDGWDIRDSLTTKNGNRGFFAESKIETSLATGAPKKAYYVEGDSWDLGWLHGALSARNGDAQKMCTTYLHHIIINLLNETWDEEMAAKCEGWVPGQDTNPTRSKKASVAIGDNDISCDTYETLLNFMETWLVAGSMASYNRERENIPTELTVEMQGFVRGSLEYDTDSGCSFDKMIYLNYGIDFLMANLYTGNLPRVISEQAAATPSVTAHVAQELANMQSESVFSIPYFCDAFSAVGDATASGKGVYMARDFQLTTGLVYQDTAADIVFVPSDPARVPHVSSGAPGFIGRVTGMNTYGVSMGVDMLRAAPCNPDTPGLNSIQLVRYVMDHAKSTAEAVELVASAVRGTTWLYPICDSSGDCVTIEAGKSTPEGELFNPLQYVNSTDVKAALPSDEFYRAHSSDKLFDRGMYTRPMNWKYPTEYLDYNEGLYGVAGLDYDGSDEVWGATGYLFDDFEQENEITKGTLHNNYFTPQREEFTDISIISNNAIVPEFRTSMMSYGGNFWQVTAHAAQWRYDELNAQLTAARGMIDAQTCIDIVSFLSPDKVPGYWTNTIDAENPMSAIVEGTMNVVDIREGRLYTKTGYWADGWTHLTLANYISKL